MRGAAEKITAGLSEAVDIARQAGEVAHIIQTAREDGDTATLTAYRILGHLGLCRFHEPPPRAPKTAWECPIKQPGCTTNCGNYGCGN